MRIIWTQTELETLAKGFASWREFTDKYPGAREAAKKGKIDPWQVWIKGGGKGFDDNPEAIYEASEAEQMVLENYLPLARQIAIKTVAHIMAETGEPALPATDDQLIEMARIMQEAQINQILHNRKVKIEQEQKRLALTDGQLVERMNAFAYLADNAAMLPYIRQFQERGLPRALLHKIFHNVLDNVQNDVIVQA
jgi:hypothetical protein